MMDIMDIDATSLYPSAWYDKKSVCFKTEMGFAFKPHMKNVYVEAFKKQTFNQDVSESAILEIECYDSPNLILRHLPVKENGKNIEVNRMRNGCLIDTSTSINSEKL